jgi:tRNA A37 threonylcarbamoyladenosine dehydratase
MKGCEKFKRTEHLLGAAALKKLQRSRIAVFGLGAVGSFALEALVRSGVGALTLVDFDEIRPSNFNRQLLALESTLGQLKVDAARRRALDINPGAKIDARPAFADAQNLAELLTPRPEAVIDAIDSLAPKVALVAFCVRQGIPVVSSMGSGAKTDPFSVRAADIAQTDICPLARRVRKRLKRLGVSGGVRCVYAVQRPVGDFAMEAEEEAVARGRRRRPVSSIAHMTGIFGLTVAWESLKILLGDAR